LRFQTHDVLAIKGVDRLLVATPIAEFEVPKSSPQAFIGKPLLKMKGAPI
jgi:hypothetical protein